MTDHPSDPPRAPPKPLGRNARGYRQTHAFGHRIKGDPQPTTISDLVNSKNYWRRAARGLIGFNERVEEAAHFAGSVKMNRPDEAVCLARTTAFGHRFDGLPLCEIERDLVERMNAVVFLVAYTGCKRAIERQLIAAQRSEASVVIPEAPQSLSATDLSTLLRFDAFEHGSLGAEAFAHGVAVFCRLAFGPDDPRAAAFKDAMTQHAARIAAEPPLRRSPVDMQQVRSAFANH